MAMSGHRVDKLGHTQKIPMCVYTPRPPKKGAVGGLGSGLGGNKKAHSGQRMDLDLEPALVVSSEGLKYCANYPPLNRLE